LAKSVSRGIIIEGEAWMRYTINKIGEGQARMDVIYDYKHV